MNLSHDILKNLTDSGIPSQSIAIDVIHRSVVTTTEHRLTLLGKDILCEKVRFNKNVGGIFDIRG